jgi:predicted DNA repair protein MutK
VLVGIAVAMTIGVYGLVAGIVKLDDLGLWLTKRPGHGAGVALQHRIGMAILKAAPYLMRTLTVVGTAAMFLVGGGILTHGLAAVHHAIEAVAALATDTLGSWVGAVVPTLLDGLFGVAAGALVVLGVTVARKLLAKPALAG